MQGSGFFMPRDFTFKAEKRQKVGGGVKSENSIILQCSIDEKGGKWRAKLPA
jgi:hypothetical protein